MDTASWKRLVAAVEFYEDRGFQSLSMPWHVPYDVASVTCKDDNRMFELRGNGILVGSAEQSFIEAQKKGRLGPGRFVAITPCFRNEGEARDELHALYFMKVELYSTYTFMKDEDHFLSSVAREFMQGQTDKHIDRVKTDEGYDLEIGGTEVGSYSSRRHEGLAWTCGTGIAEPRFSQAIACL